MSRQPLHRSTPLTVEAIVAAARAIIDEDGLAALSMRRLGAELGVDPMAVYHHVPGKRQLLAFVMREVVGEMTMPAEEAPWEDRVRGWATAYREVVTANRELVSAALADPLIAEGGAPAIGPLTEAIAQSGLDPAVIEANAWLVVDFVHGSALGTMPLRDGPNDPDLLARAFAAGLDTIVAGIVNQTS